MIKIFVLLKINFILVLGVSSLFGQDSDQKSAKKHFDRGIAAIETAETLEDFNDAIKEFETAKTLAPDWADIYYNLGIVYDKAEKYDEAIKNLQHYLKISANSDEIAEIETMITKIEYKNEKATREQNKYKDLIGTWDRYDPETGETLDNFTFLLKDDGLYVQTFGGVGQGLVTVPVSFDGSNLSFTHTDKQSLYSSEVTNTYKVKNPKLMEGTIQVNVLSKQPNFPIQLGLKPAVPMEMRKR